MAVKWITSDTDAWLPGRALELELTSAADNDWIILNSMEKDSSATVGLEITTGEGYVEFTGESFQSMVDDTATGLAWDQGNVTATTYTCFPGITGVKPVWVSGTIKIVIVL